jgi:hypothetical protein
LALRGRRRAGARFAIQRLYLIIAADFWTSGSLFYSSGIALGGKQSLGLFGNAKELPTHTYLWTEESGTEAETTQTDYDSLEKPTFLGVHPMPVCQMCAK